MPFTLRWTSTTDRGGRDHLDQTAGVADAALERAEVALAVGRAGSSWPEPEGGSTLATIGVARGDAAYHLAMIRFPPRWRAVSPCPIRFTSMWPGQPMRADAITPIRRRGPHRGDRAARDRRGGPGRDGRLHRDRRRGPDRDDRHHPDPALRAGSVGSASAHTDPARHRRASSDPGGGPAGRSAMIADGGAGAGPQCRAATVSDASDKGRAWSVSGALL